MKSTLYRFLRPAWLLRTVGAVFVVIALVGILVSLSGLSPLASLVALPVVVVAFAMLRGFVSAGVRIGQAVEVRGLFGLWSVSVDEVTELRLTLMPPEVVIVAGDRACLFPLAGRYLGSARGRARAMRVAKDLSEREGLHMRLCAADEPVAERLQVSSVTALSKANLLGALCWWPIVAACAYCALTAALASSL